MSSEEFIKVTNKRRKSRRAVQIAEETLARQLSNISITQNQHIFDNNAVTRRILVAKDELKSSEFYIKFKGSLCKAHSLLGKSRLLDNPFHEFICFGIGHVSECPISCFQFALILCLHDEFNFKSLKVYDPVLTESEVQLLAKFNFVVLEENLEGKYAVENSTIFFLPHCPKQLSNNLIWSNWSQNCLGKCILIANSFQMLIESNTHQVIMDNLEYILRISPYLTEISVENCFKHLDVFNDTAIHVFNKVNSATSEFWLHRPEPKYIDDEIEFVQSSKGAQ